MKKSIEVSSNIETLFGTRDENVRLLEDSFNISIDLRSNSIDLEGAARDVARLHALAASRGGSAACDHGARGRLAGGS